MISGKFGSASKNIFKSNCSRNNFCNTHLGQLSGRDNLAAIGSRYGSFRCFSMGNEQCRSKCDTGVCECYDEKSVSKSQEDLRTAESMIPDEGLSARGPEGDVPDSIIAAASPNPAILASLIDDVCEAGVSTLYLLHND